MKGDMTVKTDAINKTPKFDEIIVISSKTRK